MRKGGFLLFVYLAAGATAALPAGRTPHMHAEVRVHAPASGLVDVRLELPAELMAGREHIDLGFAAARELAAAVRRIEAHAGGRALRIVEPDPRRPYIKRILRPPGVGRTVLAYTIDPTYFPPGQRQLQAGNARARMTGQLGIVRTSSLFPRFAAADRLPADVRFHLPAGWTEVTPWRRSGEGYRLTAEEFASTDFLGLGPFATTQVAIGDSRVRIGTLASGRALPLETVRRLVRGALEVVRQPLPGGIVSAVVVPHGFMNGGSAGDRTVVQPAWPEVLAHEIFHWWNDAELTADDAAWFREGVSEYYGLRIAEGAGAITRREARACLADLDAEARLLDGDDPVSLVDASLASDLNTYGRRLVYAKGALFALVLERYLATRGRSLDEGVRAVLASGREGLQSADIAAIFGRVYGGATDALFRRYVEGEAVLPELALPPATGTSGCARFGAVPGVPRRTR